MKTVRVNAGNPYDVSIERGLLARAGEWLGALTPSRTAALITDDQVNALYGDLVIKALTASGFQVARFVFEHGEQRKTLETYGAVLSFLAENHITRTDTVVALGGGVTGDLAGFAAATYLRGLAVAQIPTTLLAMVDSSVGGKTGVNLPSGKNLVGAFHQPIGVLCDPDVLSTLPADVFADGMAETIKYGMLCDETLFDTLAAGAFSGGLERIIERCVAIKASVCAGDECDRGQRQLLNLGHTFGHAIEKCSGFTIAHGHAVAIGMVYVTKIAVNLGLCASGCLTRLTDALASNSLPVAAPYTADRLAEAILGDKKRTGDMLTLVMPRGIGHCVLHPVPVNQLLALAMVALS